MWELLQWTGLELAGELLLWTGLGLELVLWQREGLGLLGQVVLEQGPLHLVELVEGLLVLLGQEQTWCYSHLWVSLSLQVGDYRLHLLVQGPHLGSRC